MGHLTTSRVFAFWALLFVLAAQPAKAQQQSDWTWTDYLGKTHTRAELDEVLRKHREWLESKGKSGVWADLNRANLSRADLRGADLTRARVDHADLSHSVLEEALLSGVDLGGANLDDADLSNADLHDAFLNSAHLNGTQLGRAHLTRARIGDAHLAKANLNSANLEEAELYFADMRDAVLLGAALTGAHMLGVRLHGAELDKANLSGAELEGADLTGARLNEAALNGADLYNVNLRDAIFEPKSIPEIRGIAAARNLELLTYIENPDALVQLRRGFADQGFRHQERKITYALMRREAELSWEACKSRKTGDKTRAILWSSDSNLANCGSFVLNRVFFDWTCQYGMSPGRPLSLGVLVWAFCSILYFVSIRASGEAGLYRVYTQNIHDDPSGQKRVEKISPPAITQTGRVRRLLQFVTRERAVLRASMFFSLMSAFNIGFRDINFGRWLRLLTRQEFDIKAVGWARVVAGWQSLISVYFIALWVLTYFGRPFG